jgi:hypothetical protein
MNARFSASVAAPAGKKRKGEPFGRRGVEPHSGESRGIYEFVKGTEDHSLPRQNRLTRAAEQDREGRREMPLC